MATSTRICVKSLPKHLTDARFKAIFEEVGDVTDVKIVRTADGKSRRFGFIGFTSPESAQRAVDRFNNTYVDTSRVQVELALGVGDAALPRPWSKHSEGSSGHKKLKEKELAEQLKQEKRSKMTVKPLEDALTKQERDAKFEEFLNSVKGKGVSTKAGLGKKKEKKVVMPWENVEEEDDDKKRERAGKKDEEEEVEDDDDAWMRAKMGKKAKIEEEEDDDDDDDVDVDEKAHHVSDDEDDDANRRKHQAERAAKVASTRRLFIRNVAQVADDTQLKKHLEQFGNVVELTMPISNKTGTHKGYAFAQWSSPEEALVAFSSLDGHPFFGRLLHVLPADAKKGEASDQFEEKVKGTSSFKRQREKQMKEADPSARQALFVATDTAAAVTAAKLGMDKAQLLSAEMGGSVAVRAALAEAEVISDVRKFLQDNGVVPDLLKNVDRKDIQRSDKVFLVKNLPAGSTREQLVEVFAPYGDLGRLLLVPGGALAIVEYIRPAQAQKAFRRAAFSNFRGVPLYLHWAPVSTFLKPSADVPEGEQGKEDEKAAAPSTESDKSRASVASMLVDDEGTDDGATSVFVKNLAFSTTRDALASHVGEEGVRSVTIISKNGKSLGYGFVEFRSKEAAVKAMKRLAGLKLDGHVLELQLSQKNAGTKEKKKRKTTDKQAEESSKIVVRNVPFEATKKELKELLGAYGSLKSLRLPVKFDGTHRGFCFGEYVSKTEAKKALEALESAHLYGRHLVIEYAKEGEEELLETRQKAAKKFENAASKE